MDRAVPPTSPAASSHAPAAITAPGLLDEDGLPVPRRYWAMLTVFLGILLAVLDGTISNVALPTIASDLRASPAASIWVVNAYQLAITVSLLPLASLGEIVGYQRIYRGGLLLFVVASLFCALSHTLAVLTLARVLQGLGAAGIMSVNGALIRFIYPRRLLGRGIGFNAMVVAISSAIGPTVAAGILSVGSWPWLFAVNIPIGLVAILLSVRSLPDTPRAGHRFDGSSALLSALTFGLLIAVLSHLGRGLGWVEALGVLGVASMCGVALVRRQQRQPAPLLPVDLMRIPVFALSIGTSILSFAAQMLAFVSLPFFIQNTLGHSVVQTGLLLTPWPLALTVVAPLAGRLSERYPAGLLGAVGLLAMACGLMLIAMLPAHPGDLALAWRLALCGAGFGLFQTPNNRTIMQAAPRARSGGASGMLSTARLLGQTTGAALVATIFSLAPTGGTIMPLEVAAGCALLAALISAARITTTQHQPT